MKQALANSFAIALPATIIPIAIAAFAAYAFAWIEFKGRQPLFIVTVSLLAIPTQVALIPLLQMYVGGAHITIPCSTRRSPLFPDSSTWPGRRPRCGSPTPRFAMPFAIFLLHNYISSLPKDLFEAARIDGANHFKIFYRLVLPLSVPVLAAFAIFQFLWTWNDYLIAMTMVGANPDALPATVKIASQAGEFGRLEHLLTAGAFLQAAVPMAVFFLLQRFFVRGILAGIASRASIPASRIELVDRRNTAPSVRSATSGRSPSASGASRATTSARRRQLVEAALDAGAQPRRHGRRVRPRLGRHRVRGVRGAARPRARRAPVVAPADGAGDEGRHRPADAVRLQSRRGLRAACEASLRRLGVDVDRPLPDPPAGPAHPPGRRRRHARRRSATRARSARSACPTTRRRQVDALRAHLPFPIVDQPARVLGASTSIRCATERSTPACATAWCRSCGARWPAGAWPPAPVSRPELRRRARRARRARGRRPGHGRPGVRPRPPVAPGRHHRDAAARADHVVARRAAACSSTAPTSTPSSKPRKELLLP